MLYLLALVCFYVTNGHMLLSFPEPRRGSDGTYTSTDPPGGLTTGPCGGDEYGINDPDDNNNITELEPGINTIVLDVQAAHADYQYRISLAKPSGNVDDDPEEFDECILIDHVPQYTTAGVDSTHINVSIPNVDCDECTLQVTMSESTTTCCNRYNETCMGTVYYSCATVKINGKKSWSKRECEQPCVWGWRDYPENYYGGATNNNYWTLSGGELWLDYTADYMEPDETCCEMAFGNKGCDDTEDDKCKWFEGGGSTSSKSNSNSGYSNAEKKSGEQAGIAIFIILVLAIGGTIAYTYFFKKKPLDQDNGALIMPTTTKTGQIRSQTIGSIQNTIVRDDTNYVTSDETNDVKPMPIGVNNNPPPTTGYTQPPVPPPRNDQPVYQQEQQNYEPQEYQPQEYQQQSNDYQTEEQQQYEAPQQYEEPQQQYTTPEEPQQQYEEPQQYEAPDQYEEPEVEIPQMDNYDAPPQFDENQYQNDQNPTDGYDM